MYPTMGNLIQPYVFECSKSNMTMHITSEFCYSIFSCPQNFDNGEWVMDTKLTVANEITAFPPQGPESTAGDDPWYTGATRSSNTDRPRRKSEQGLGQVTQGPVKL